MMKVSNKLWKLLLVLITVWICFVCAAKKKKSTSSNPTSPPTTKSSTSKNQRETEEEKSSSNNNNNNKNKVDKELEKQAKLQAENEKKLQQLRDKINKNPLVSLTDDNFSKFVIDRPREYHAILMFTATDPMYKCGICVKTKQIFEEVAKAYNLQYNFTTTPIYDRIIFFRVEVDDARTIFGNLQLETVPRFYALPPTAKDSPKLKLETLEIESKAFLEGASSALEYISGITKVKIQVLHDPTLALLIGGFLSLLFALFITFAHRDLWNTFLFYQTPYLWVVISMICFGVGVSGSIFCIIRSPQLLGYGAKGELAIFAPQGREQYSIEGIVVALWTIGCGVSFFVMYLATKIRFPLVQHGLVILSMTIFVVLSLEIWQAYTSKTMWYSLRETVPPYVWLWITGSVKKNSGLLKRLFRVSELWLTGKGDFSGWYAKFEPLVIDYLKRIFFGSKTQ